LIVPIAPALEERRCEHVVEAGVHAFPFWAGRYRIALYAVLDGAAGAPPVETADVTVPPFLPSETLDLPEARGLTLVGDDAVVLHRQVVDGEGGRAVAMFSAPRA
jgi:hypothetical protein